ncbi:hypothetical protein HYH03_018943 [Edaphochlamys debaryana]|uniref:Uncharacterized protein n=2 Tax=Edaphochlamys debaryana TaxID=47281 RepID=A0A835XDP4_9CHLO|nr:hypothetical protein HYH03_018943 [Edaphochlamys debaryana]|eukprot:KAG2482103.1 hypothetical protein HYH03_018943 [Edaphochlamys debaryana]
MNAIEWRKQQLTTQSARLQDALGMWQGCNTSMGRILRALQSMGIDMEQVENVCVIWKELEAAKTLPYGLTVWRAVPPSAKEPVVDSDAWIPVSATLEGAEAWARSNLTGGKATICKIIISDSYVRALAVGSDPDYEHEAEILLMPHVSFAQRPTAKQQTTASGNVIATFEVRGEQAAGYGM